MDALSCESTGLAMVRSSVQGVLPECLNVFIVSEICSESEQGRGPNTGNKNKTNMVR
jgi:hypothetical protein